MRVATTWNKTMIGTDAVAGDFAANTEVVMIGRIMARLKCLCKGKGHVNP